MELKQGYGLKRPDSPYNEAECDEIIAKLEALLDGDMDADRQQEVQDMINNCQYCLEQYKIEQTLKNLIKGGFQNFKVSSKLIDNIRSSIKNVRKK